MAFLIMDICRSIGLSSHCGRTAGSEIDWNSKAFSGFLRDDGPHVSVARNVKTPLKGSWPGKFDSDFDGAHRYNQA